MNYAGQDLKFMVESLYENLLLTRDKFAIVLVNRWGNLMTKPDGSPYVITKDDCFWDADGRYYFTVECIQNGIWFARFRGAYEDEDYDKQECVVADEQKLFECGICNCENKSTSSSCQCKHKVRYTEVTVVSVDGDEYLCGSDGQYIFTSDGKRICFKNPKRKQIEDMGKVILDTMTGEEFKKLIEGRDPNGEINTLPEMLDAARGISDDETIKEEVEQQIEEDAGMTYEGKTRTLFINGAKPKPESEASTAESGHSSPIVVEEEEEP